MSWPDYVLLALVAICAARALDEERELLRMQRRLHTLYRAVRPLRGQKQTGTPIGVPVCFCRLRP